MIEKMTKKQQKEFYKQQRSQVALGRNIGGHVMTSSKDYDRHRSKSEVRKLLQEI